MSAVFSGDKRDHECEPLIKGITSRAVCLESDVIFALHDFCLQTCTGSGAIGAV